AAAPRPSGRRAARRIRRKGRTAGRRGAAALPLRGSGGAAGQIPDDPPRQRMDAGVLRIVREPAPVPGAAAAPPPEAGDLLPSPFIDSDHPPIVARARAIARQEDDPLRRAEHILASPATSPTPGPT